MKKGIEELEQMSPEELRDHIISCDLVSNTIEGCFKVCKDLFSQISTRYSLTDVEIKEEGDSVVLKSKEIKADLEVGAGTVDGYYNPFLSYSIPVSIEGNEPIFLDFDISLDTMDFSDFESNILSNGLFEHGIVINDKAKAVPSKEFLSFLSSMGGEYLGSKVKESSTILEFGPKSDS